MAKLLKGKTEWEGMSFDQYSIVEGEEPARWPPGAAFEFIGKSIPRVDGPAKVTGRAVYTYDTQLPGMLYGRVLRSPYPHARIRGIDVSKAVAYPGVRAVISYSNAPATVLGDTRVFDRTVRYAGDEVAAVAADDGDIAEDALALIDVDYEELPFIIDIEGAVKPDAPMVGEGGNIAGGKGRQYQRGDVQRGFAEADIIVEETFRTQSAQHSCMEPHGVVAAWNGDDLTVWESTQSISRVQGDIAAFFNLPLNKVNIICEFMGGGFGAKQFTGKWSVIAALLAKLADRPVQLMLTRPEEAVCSGHRAPTVQHLKIGAKNDGTLTAIELTADSNVGALGRPALAIDGPAQVMYACPNVKSEVRSVFTNTGPARSFRGPGYVEGAFPLESLMDELASRLKIDPLEMRRKNYARNDPSAGRPYSAKHLDECYEKGAEMIGWQTVGETVRRHGNKVRATGMASLMWGGGGGPPAYAWVRINSDGSAEVITGSQDIGTGTRTVFAQIAAEELGIELERVSVHVGETSKGPYAPVSWGSMTISAVGPAIREAAADARRQLHDIIAGFLSVAAESVSVKGGSVHIQGEEKPRMKVSQLTDQLGQFTILGKGSRWTNQTGAEVRTFGAQFADVEVDTTTGEVTVLKVVSVHDCGRVMNPMGGANQVEGALVQGIGYGIMEERVIDQCYGVVLTPDLHDYKVLTSMDVPDIGHAFIDKPDDLANNLSAKGLGEPAMIATAPAIANAIARATGVRFLSLPITRPKILEALGRKVGTEGGLP
jgi:xanthine dehydrogenase YagR molybdenum-binding subunit